MRLPNYIDDLEKWRSEFEFSTEIKIRFSETDMFGHVNNVSPFIYFEEARIDYFDSIKYLVNDSENNDSIPVVADLQCDYHRELYFGNHLTMYVKVNRAGNSSIDMHYLGLNEKGEVCLTGRGALVNIDPHTKKATPLNETLKSKMLKN